MNRDLDMLIKDALAPSADLTVPASLADDIHQQLLATPQRRRGIGDRLGRWLPDTPALRGPALAWVATLLLLLLAIVVVLGVASRRDQPMPPEILGYHGGQGQTGIMPGPAPEGQPAIRWEVEFLGGMNNLSMPVVRDGVAYFVTTNGLVTAVDVTTGKVLWDRDELGQGSGSPVLLGDALVVAATDGTVVALDAATGEPVWSASIEAEVSSPLNVAGNTIIVGTTDGVRGVDATSLLQRWFVETDGPVARSPAVVDGIVYAAADGGDVFAVEAATGERRWLQQLGPGEISTPAVADGVIYLIHGPNDETSPHALVAIDTTTGDIRNRWNSPTNDRMFTGAVVDGVVVSVAEDGVVRTVTVGTGDGFQTLFEAGAEFGSLAAVVGETLFLTTNDGAVRAVDLDTGEERWRVQVEGSPTMPVVVDGVVIVGTSLGRAVAIAEPSAAP